MAAPRDNSIPIHYPGECFVYDVEADALTWLQRPLDHFPDERAWKIWNTLWAGKPAGSKRKDDYSEISLTVEGQRYKILRHRLIIALTKGYWPPDQVDHEDRNPAANKIENLREATNAQNQQNSGLDRRNKSGFKGVSWHRDNRKWRAEIEIEKRKIHLGLHVDILDAIVARQRAEEELHPFRPRLRLDADIFVLPPDCSVADVEEWKRDVRNLWQLPPRIHWQA
jgi:hypothetical protein